MSEPRYPMPMGCFGPAVMIVLLLLFITLFGCSTTKTIEKVVVKVDSTAIHERDSIAAVKTLDSAGYMNLIQAMSENVVQFRDTGSVRIEYRPDGSISVVQGQVRSLNNKLASSISQAGYWKHQYDSLAGHRSKDSVQIRTEVKTITVVKKVRFLPWWWWLVVGGVLLIALIAFIKGGKPFPIRWRI